MTVNEEIQNITKYHSLQTTSLGNVITSLGEIEVLKLEQHEPDTSTNHARNENVAVKIHKQQHHHMMHGPLHRISHTVE